MKRGGWLLAFVLAMAFLAVACAPDHHAGNDDQSPADDDDSSPTADDDDNDDATPPTDDDTSPGDDDDNNDDDDDDDDDDDATPGDDDDNDNDNDDATPDDDDDASPADDDTGCGSMFEDYCRLNAVDGHDYCVLDCTGSGCALTLCGDQCDVTEEFEIAICELQWCPRDAPTFQCFEACDQAKLACDQDNDCAQSCAGTATQCNAGCPPPDDDVSPDDDDDDNDDNDTSDDDNDNDNDNDDSSPFCSIMATGAIGPLAGVWGSSASNVFAVGASGTILHYGPPK